ncbi:MAG TPA: DUF2442 domain-containing protein [Anaerolineales bacterium]|nr:DUF2442 domain-containing protein [Anaerolineales bacterium]
MSTLVIDIQDLRAQEVEVKEDTLVVSLTDGRVISVPLAWFPRLWYGTAEERANFEIIGDSNYIHWPDLDEDLSVSGIIAGKRSKENPESLKKWLEARNK